MKLALKTTDFVAANKVVIPDIYYNRLKTGIIELDEFLGGSEDPMGGFLRGGVYMIAAGAGSGKSTFCLQAAEALIGRGYRVAYASGEESIEQLAFSCKRLNVKKTPIAVQTDIDYICSKMENLDIIFIDSFQTLTVGKHMTPRKKEQYCIRQLCARAKATGCAIVALCHLTKAGVYKGSTTVLHAIDACIKIEVDEEEPSVRFFSWNKNRFGPTDKEMSVTLTRSGYMWTEKAEVSAIPATPVAPVTTVDTSNVFEKISKFKKDLANKS